jgi:hypothetical protein
MAATLSRSTSVRISSMHRCNECGEEFNDVYDGRWGDTPIGYGWDPGMPKPCCGGTGAWEDAFWRSKTDKSWRPAKRRRPSRAAPEKEGDDE